MNIRTIAAILIGAFLLFCAIALMTGTGTVTDFAQEPPTLPATYDLRDMDGRCYITPVKTQAGTLPDGQLDITNTVGTCWAFAACAAFESSLLRQGIVSDPESPAANLSVWHMGNWNGYNHPVYVYNSDSMPNSTLSIGYTETEPVIRGWGGDYRYATDYLIHGRGPVLDQYAPFPLDDIQEKKNLTKPPEHLPVTYMLRETIILCRPDYSTDEEFRSAVKQALMKYGALESFQYAHPSTYPGTEETSIFNRTSGDYYFNGTGDELYPASLNHAVTIAGWDDTRVIRGAPEPGAWLIKNSVGTEFGNEGYFWISYADVMFLKGDDMVVAFVADSGEGYDTVHRYETADGALSDVSTEPYEISWDYLSDGSAAAGGESLGCARFIAEEDGDLRAVGFMTLNRNEDVTVDVYGGWEEMRNRPDPDALFLSDTVQVPEQGYHLIDLSRQIPLKEGDEFVIALGYAARTDTEEVREPLIYVASDTPQSNRTFRSLSGQSEWEDYATLHNGSIFYVQGFMAA